MLNQVQDSESEEVFVRERNLGVPSSRTQNPLFLKINMGDEGLYTIIGPYISYLPTINKSAPDEKALGFGGTFGFGTRVGDHFIMEGRYNFNGNVWKLGTDSSKLYGFRNTTIGLSLGYLF